MTTGLNLHCGARFMVFVEMEGAGGWMRTPPGAGHRPSSQHAHPEVENTPAFSLNDCAHAWGENTDHLYFPCALMNHSPPSHQHKGDNSLTACSDLRLHLHQKRDSLCLRRRLGDSALFRSSSLQRALDLWLQSCLRDSCILKLLMVYTEK